MVKGNHAVELALRRSGEDRVRRIGPAYSQTFSPRRFYGWNNVLRLFVSKEPAFACMRIQTGHGQGGDYRFPTPGCRGEPDEPRLESAPGEPDRGASRRETWVET